ncbi:MAG: hypothetical protein LQ339_008765 [Xanthoria mediterranea]|nr:MAG: hypothetical protein LQ339_008765 [Xanthoria mediterranea]
MARSDEAQWWFHAVYEAVQEIPPGSVTSYGHIARLLGRREYHQSIVIDGMLTGLCSSGMPSVGVCLKHLPAFSDDGDHFFHDQNVPWQRVINAKGMISPRGPGGAARQAAALRQEGVTVGTTALGEFIVDLR